MASLKTVAVAALAATAAALPSSIRHARRQAGEQAPAPAAPATISSTDLDNLQFACFAEQLENDLYERMKQLPAQQFADAGLSRKQMNDIFEIGSSEGAHVSLLQGVIAQNGGKPVQKCTYDFKATDVKTMLPLAQALEEVGVSAYAGAAALIENKNVLTTAASILSTEGRHQTTINSIMGVKAVSRPLDTPLSVRAVVTLASPFVVSCPEGSSLNVQPFPTLDMQPGQDASSLQPGSMIKLQAASGGSGTATHCGFSSGNLPSGGVDFTAFSQTEGCKIPENQGSGVSYVFLVSGRPEMNSMAVPMPDDLVVAGPMILNLKEVEQAGGMVMNAQGGEVMNAQGGEVMKAKAGEAMKAKAGEAMKAKGGER